MPSDYNLPQKISGLYYNTNVGDNTYTFHIEDGWLYKPGRQNHRLDIYDLDSPGSNTYSGSITDSTYLNGLIIVEGDCLKGDYLYTRSPSGDTYGYITVVNVSNKSAPTRTTSKRDTTYLRNPACACIIGDYLYVGANGGATKYMTIWDISAPNNPTKVTNKSFGSTSVTKLWTHGGYLYVGTGGTLTIYDVSSTPTNPSAMGSITFSPSGGSYRGFYAEGNYAYFSNDNTYGAIQIVDVSNPSSLSEVHQWHCDDDVGYCLINDIWVDTTNSLLYAAESNYNRGILIYDISSPTNPQYIDSFTYNYSSTIKYYDGIWYVCGDDNADAGEVTAYDLTVYKLSGNTTHDTHLCAYRPSDYERFDDWSVEAGDYTVKPIYKNDPLHILAIADDSNVGSGSYKNVVPVISN